MGGTIRQHRDSLTVRERLGLRYPRERPRSRTFGIIGGQWERSRCSPRVETIPGRLCTAQICALRLRINARQVVKTDFPSPAGTLNSSSKSSNKYPRCQAFFQGLYSRHREASATRPLLGRSPRAIRITGPQCLRMIAALVRLLTPSSPFGGAPPSLSFTRVPTELLPQPALLPTLMAPSPARWCLAWAWSVWRRCLTGLNQRCDSCGTPRTKVLQ